MLLGNFYGENCCFNHVPCLLSHFEYVFPLPLPKIYGLKILSTPPRPPIVVVFYNISRKKKHVLISSLEGNVLHHHVLFNAHFLYSNFSCISESVYVVCRNPRRYLRPSSCFLSIGVIILCKVTYQLRITNETCLLTSLCILHDKLTSPKISLPLFPSSIFFFGKEFALLWLAGRE